MTEPTSVVVVGIAGGTGAGKSRLAQALTEAVGGPAVALHVMQDWYYHDLSHFPLSERSSFNFDCPSALDTALLLQHLRQWKRQEHVSIPSYDFTTHTRRKEESEPMAPKKIIIVEGILLFCDPELVKELDIKVYVVSSVSK
jgi:uridine kinase